jgi:ABC-2 type transport system permease protein
VPVPDDAALPLHYPVIFTILWSIFFTAVFAPAAVAAFRRRSRD